MDMEDHLSEDGAKIEDLISKLFHRDSQSFDHNNEAHRYIPTVFALLQ